LSPQSSTSQSDQLIGWQGLTFTVPADWTVGAVSGDQTEGYLRIDGAELPRLEIRWSESKGAPDLTRTVQRYLRSLQRDKKQPQPVEVDDDSRFLSKRKVGKDDMRAFAWRGKQAGYGVAWYCKACSRVVIAQALGKPDEKDLEDRAVRLLSGIDDHPRGDWTTWALYDLHTEVPRGFEQAGVNLRAGLTELSFKRDTERVVVARWGMAEVARRGRPLDAWARQQFQKQWQAFRPTGAPTTFRGHEAVVVTGQSQQPFGLVVRLGRHMARKEHADQLVAHIWHCEPTNRLYVVYGFVDVTNRALVEEIRDRTRCH
jgi:hypothetical protein